MAKLVTGHTRAGESGRLITCPHCQAQDRVYHFTWAALTCKACKAKVQKLEWVEEAYRKRPTVTIEQAWNWLGERGMDVSKRDIRVRGRWALVRTRGAGCGWDHDVECYNVLSGSSYAEPWDAIKYEDSPFVPDNATRTEIALAKVEKSWEEDENEEFQGDGLCLIALSGDCAKGGMGNANEVLPFRPEHNGLIKAFLEAQLAFDMHCAFGRYSPNGIDYGSPETQTISGNEVAAGQALRDAGVFHHKYHLRTTWELAYMGELGEIERYKPFQVMYPKLHTPPLKEVG
jgi:hypothetical protein